MFDMFFTRVLRSQVAIYTAFHKDSESEVKKCQLLEPGGKSTKSEIKLFFVARFPSLFAARCLIHGRHARIFGQIVDQIFS